MTILAHDGTDFDFSIPVCVIGAGACGLTAAIAAAQAGAEVAVFEADETPRGSTAMTIGLICAANTKLQRELGVEDSADSLVADIERATRGETDLAHARFLAEQSGPTIDWMVDEIGCPIKLETNWSGYGHSQIRCHGTPNNSGEELMAMLLDAAERLGVNLVTRSKVTDLIVDRDRIVGLQYETPDGMMRVGCEAVIIASSGYGANADLIKTHIPEMANAIYHGCENHHGDAILWGEALGAETADLGSYQGVGTLTPYGFGIPHSMMVEGAYKVNLLGERYENELENLSGQAKNAIAQPEGKVWLIFDERIHRKTCDMFAEYKSNAELIEGACKFDTYEAIAERTGMNAQNFLATIAQISELTEETANCPFGRPFNAQNRLEAPLYALRLNGAIFHTQGGLCIDQTARVRRKSGGVFENLFAGGGAARSVSGPAEWGYLPAIGLTTAVVFGRIAGQEAAKLATKA